MTKSSGKTLFLCGMMGSGKSTIANELAEYYGITSRDLDTCIEEDAGLSIPDIFRTKGEAWFRELEKQVLIREASAGHGVLALGGGSLQHQLMVDHVKLNGWLIFLDTPIKTILDRIADPHGRPMLADGDRDAQRRRIEHLMNQRLPFYRQAHITVQTENLQPKQIAEQIDRNIKRYE